MNYRIYPPEEIVEASVAVPLSKSVSARALIIEAISHRAVEAGDTAECHDTEAIRAALSAPLQGSIDVADSGTALRFLTAYFAVTDGADIEIRGSERLCQRPIGPLVDVLRSLGASIEYMGESGYAPLKICGRRLTGGSVTIDASVSSQFVSALLMIAPTMANGLSLQIEGDAVSQSYIRLTISMMERAGVECDITPDGITVAPGQQYQSCQLDAERDWSAATFWYEAMAVTSGFITVEGLAAGSRQPDAAAAEIFGRLGVTTDFDETPGSAELAGSPDVDPRMNICLSDNPDMAPALAVTCTMIGVPFRFTGLSTLPAKECDRIVAMAEELTKIGVTVETTPDSLTWEGRRMPFAELPRFSPHGDHRMAMALAFVAAYIPGIMIENAEVVDKSYPGFWEQLSKCGFIIEDANPEPISTES